MAKLITDKKKLATADKIAEKLRKKGELTVEKAKELNRLRYGDKAPPSDSPKP